MHFRNMVNHIPRYIIVILNIKNIINCHLNMLLAVIDYNGNSNLDNIIYSDWSSSGSYLRKNKRKQISKKYTKLLDFLTIF